MSARKRIVGALLALLVLVAVVFWLLRSGAEVTPVASPSSAAPPPVGSPELGTAVVSEPASEREAVAEPSAALPAANGQLAHLRGRCVDERGAALAGCRVELDGWQGNSNRMALQGDVDWHDPEPLQTSDDGRFDFAFAPPSGLQWSLDVSAPGRVPRTGRWGRIDPDQVIELGDVTLGVGFTVAGRVVDEQGAPMAKVGVSLEKLPLPLAADMVANSSRSGWTDESGAFTVKVPIPAGTWPLDCSGRGLRLLGPDKVVVDGRDVRDLLVTVRRMPKIEGLVVDEQGLPVKGVEVEAGPRRSGRVASGRSRDDGTFTLFAVDAEPSPVQLLVDDPGPCEPPADSDPTLWPWGSDGVRIQLRRALGFELTVVEQGSGDPVTKYALSCYSSRARSSLQSDLRLGGEHPDGRVTVDRVWRGGNHLKVVPLDPALLPVTLDFDAGDAGVAPMRVEVERMLAAVVDVRTAAGGPVVGSKVEIIRRGARAFRVGQHATDIRSAHGFGGFAGGLSAGHAQPVSLGSAITDAAGRAAVLVPADGADLIVQVTGAHPPAVVDPAGLVPGSELVVVVSDGCELVGSVLTDGLDVATLSIELLDGEGGQVRLDDKVAKVQADGSFAVRGLAPGSYRVQLQRMVWYTTEHGGSGGREGLDIPARDVQLDAGARATVTIDATGLRPGTVVGGLLLDGAPPSPARAFVRNLGGRSYGQFVPDERGVFLAAGLLPGTYRVGLVVGDFQAGNGVSLLGDETFELAAGQRLERTFTFVRRRLRLTILKSDGKTPAANRALRMLEGDRGSLRTDEHGVVVLDPAPRDDFRLLVDSQVIGPVQMPADQTEHAVTLTLPAGR